MADQKEGLSNIVPKKNQAKYPEIPHWQLTKNLEQKDLNKQKEAEPKEKAKQKEESGALKQ